LLDEAARLFAESGYKGTTVRDVMSTLQMPGGSLYYHFSSKEDLLVAVYEEGVSRVRQAVEKATAGIVDPWERLERACVAHLRAILEEDHYARVISTIMPADVPNERERLARLRDRYEALIEAIVRDLPIAPGVDQKSLRLMLFGALNWSRVWYRPGRETPESIAHRFLQMLMDGIRPVAQSRGQPVADAKTVNREATVRRSR